MTRNIILFSLLLLALLSDCKCGRSKADLWFSEDVTNIESVNSQYDEMNNWDNSSYAEARAEIYFSSNQDSKGKDFNIISRHYSLFISDSRRREVWEQMNYYAPISEGVIKSILAAINSGADEIGPCSFPPNWIEESWWVEKSNWSGREKWVENLGKYYAFYANNSSGNYDIKFARLDSPGKSDTQTPVNGVANLLNSSSDDCYPTFDMNNGMLYFCSNRSGRFQIYRVAIDYRKDLAAALQETTQAVELVTDLSGDGNDKCPFISHNTLVFISDRSGGKGGFDLYYATYSNGSWSKPVNMEKINSPKDEYRPILNDFNGYWKNQLNNLLIFSSNREGGKGGFDLYQVGTDIFRK